MRRAYAAVPAVFLPKYSEKQGEMVLTKVGAQLTCQIHHSLRLVARQECAGRFPPLLVFKYGARSAL